MGGQNIASATMPFLSNVLWYNKLNKSRNHTSITFITCFCRNSNCVLGFNIQNGVQIIEGSDNGDSDNQGPTVPYFHRRKW